MRLLLGMPDGEEDNTPLPLPAYRQWLEQSNECMLDVYFTDFWSRWDTSHYFDETMELIVPHAHRWRILSAFNLSPEHTTQLLMHISSCRTLYALRCVALGRGTMSLQGSSAEGFRILLERAASFEQLQLKEVPPLWAEVPSFHFLKGAGDH
jgi:hypothetical protein